MDDADVWARAVRAQDQERHSCPCEEVAPIECEAIQETGGRTLLETPVARRLLIPDLDSSPRHPPVSESVRRFLETAKMANEDKRATEQAALNTLVGSDPRNEAVKAVKPRGTFGVLTRIKQVVRKTLTFKPQK